MCTVTFIPTTDGFYFTSNRDEKASRETTPPMYHNVGDMELLFPKDVKAGGTWFAVNKEGRAACLLNGAFVNHTKLDTHTKSRGQILLESFYYPTAMAFSEAIKLENVEPFTLILVAYSSGIVNQFIEFRWDGEKKHLQQLSSNLPYIWSSATLYAAEIQNKRAALFTSWLEKNRSSKDKDILNFHFNKHGLKNEEAIFMSREGDLKTISISQLVVDAEKNSFNYIDVLENKEHQTRIH